MNKTFIHKAVIGLCFVYASPMSLASDNIVFGVIDSVAKTTGQIFSSILPENKNQQSRVTAGHALHHEQVSKNAHFNTVSYTKNSNKHSVRYSKNSLHKSGVKSSDSEGSIIVKNTKPTNSTNSTNSINTVSTTRTTNTTQNTQNTIVQQPVKQTTQTQNINTTKPVTTSSNDSLPTVNTNIKVSAPVLR